MASFSSNDSVVSYHTDKRGVTMSRAKLPRAEAISKIPDSPGPAAYYDSRTALKSPAFKSGIKFSLAKKPPGMFDIPSSQVCPGPGEYVGQEPRAFGIAEFKHIKSKNPIISPKGTVLAPKTPGRRGSGSPRRAGGGRIASSSSSISSHDYFSTTGSVSKFPTAASRREAAALSAAATVEAAAAAMPGTSNPTMLSDISNISGDSFASCGGGGAGCAGGAGPARQGGTPTAPSRPKFGPRDLNLKPSVIDQELFDKLRSRLCAATYNGKKGADSGKTELFMKNDKNKDGLLDLPEVQALVRRVLKLPPEEISNAQIRAVFKALDTARRGSLNYDEFYALLGPSSSSTSAQESKPAAPLSHRKQHQYGQDYNQKQQQQQQQQPRRAVSTAPPPPQPASLAVGPGGATPAFAPQPLPPPVGRGDDAEAQVPSQEIASMISDVQRLHGDFSNQLQELGQISSALDKLLGTVAT